MTIKGCTSTNIIFNFLKFDRHTDILMEGQAKRQTDGSQPAKMCSPRIQVIWAAILTLML